MLRRFLIEREMPRLERASPAELAELARTANLALAKLTFVQWQYSFVARDRLFCVYLADSETVVREHARLAGWPADRITEIRGVLDPACERGTTAAHASMA